VRELGLALPPAPMPLLRHGRLRKRWRYVGYYSPQLMLCVGDARIGPLPQRWWAIAEPGAGLLERTSIGRGGVRIDGSTVRVRSGHVSIDMELEESEGVEVVTPAGSRGDFIWTRKQAQVPVRGSVRIGDRSHALDARAFIDDSAGYHDRNTSWRWSAGNGRTSDGRAVAWNLVAGLHDRAQASERTLWVDGEPHPLGPVGFPGPGLSGISFDDGGALSFSEWSSRKERVNMLLLRSDYRQPFGVFAGTLPGGLELAEGYGVMEQHDVLW
jgi:hypothetical protein